MTCQPVIVGDSTGTCHAEFTYAQLPGATPNTLAFTDMSISPGPVSWFWEFGDGTASNEQNPVHVFPPNSAGVVYNVCLTITGVSSTNCTDTECEPVTVGPPPACEADFEHWPANVPMSIHFLDESFGNVVNWTWEFGDGTSQTIVSPGNPNVIHTYPSPGVYNACLYIVTEDSCTSLKCESIFVGDSIFGCNADFSYIVEQVPGSNFITVIFHDLSISTTPVSWFWDFGDGTTSTEQNPVHVYPAISLTPYTACLTITSVNGNCIDTKCELIEAGQIPGCEADFEVHPAPNSLLTIHFEDLSEGDIHFWTWEFGDGITQTITYPNNPNVFHTYATPGFYTACLYIQGPDSCYSSICKIVAVGDSVPDCQAQFSYFPEPSITNTGNTIHFLDMSLGNPTQWFWNFGDGTSSNLQNPIHTYGAPGTYYVCLTISGPSCQSVWCADVEVGQSNNCVSYFTYSNIGLAVNFEGHLLNPTGGTYYWDFGDNQVGIGQNVIHSYNAPGIYYVTLTTTSGPNASCTYTSGQSITVGDSTAWNQVYGQVFAGSFPATAGMVMLFSLDTNNFFVPFVDIAMIDSAGVYYFPMVPQGDFLIHAIPFEYGYLPTYYGDVLFWQDATVVTLGTANNPYDIHLIQAGSSGGGNGMISGQLIQGDISTALVDKVTMLLKDEGGTTIRSCQVNESGNFEFTQLAMGTYYLYGEIAGCESENIKVVLSETSPSSSLNLLLSGHSILGREDKEITLEAGMIYPNPAKDNARIAIRLNTSANLTINLNSSEGHRVYSQVESVGTGQTEILIPISQLASGIYSVQIRSDKGLLLTRKLVVIK
jgi:PKD repeat protein